MRAGLLRHPLTIQNRSVTRDDTGQELESWSDVATVWGRVEPLSGSERKHGAAIEAETTHRVTLRYTTLSAADRLKLGERVLQIINILNTDERNIELVVMCKEVA
ncbi:MAG: phage head closure protein [Planctomycetaceae bacterium]